MDRDEIAQRLVYIQNAEDYPTMGGARGKKGQNIKNKLKDVDPDYYNQYKDKDTFDYQKVEIKIIRELASKLFDIDISSVKPSHMAQVKQSMINNAMKAYQRLRQEEIDRKLRADVDDLQKYKLYQSAKDKAAFMDDLKKSKKMSVQDLDKLRLPDQQRKLLKDISNPDLAKTTSRNLAIQEAYGKGLRKGKKRPPSAYNLFIKRFAQENPGLGKKMLHEAVKEWNNRK